MKYLLICLCLLSYACSEKKDAGSRQSADPHSFSSPRRVIVKHLNLDLKVDFDSHVLSGRAEWTLENLSGDKSVIFDTRDLKIEKVTTGDDQHNAEYVLGKPVKYMGQSLEINIRPSDKKVTIWYKTSPGAAALQWLSPLQTAGKKYPFLYTQSEAILARTWIPCQDSPGIRFTYNATISVPRQLLALMSAVNPQERSSSGVYHFEQKHPIPSYLMALAVGNIKFKETGKRTGVYAEPVTLNSAAWEFADMGKMVDAAESLYGPYRWGRYDLLVLPPGFPYGGMENPMLTFATPTVLAGDRSLVSLVAHELAHSWSGNLVTNATWNDFWLNEGFTVYFERRIVEKLYGTPEAKMQEVLGLESLRELIGEMGASNKDTRLKGDFAGRDPDDATSDIAYEKGYFFLRSIEDAAGRTRFDRFLKEYFASHAFQSITTEDFLSYLDDKLLANDPVLRNKIRIDDWVYRPGIPAGLPRVESEKFASIDSIVKNMLLAGDFSVDTSRISSANERLYFIKALPDTISLTNMGVVDKQFKFTKSKNSEIQCAWYLLAIKTGYAPAQPYIKDFLIHVGRRKFLLPLYKALSATPRGKKLAREIYEKARPNYHSVSYTAIDAILK